MAKHGVLVAIAHNVADSLASGLNFVIGHVETDVFGEAAIQPNHRLTADFLTGDLIGENVSSGLKRAVMLHSENLERFCLSHGAERSDFQRLCVEFLVAPTGPYFVVHVEDVNGKSSITEYGGVPGKRTKVLDSMGRLRKRPSIVPAT